MYDAIIIGAGPSGLSAALNLRRDSKTCLIIEKEAIGGQIAKSPRVENIPGIKSISGLEFTDKLFDQVNDLGAELELDEVESIEKKDNHFVVKTTYSKFEALSVIIANGVKHRHINVENEENLIGKGISYCATCDGAFYKDQDVVLIGDANTALQYAIVLSKICKTVYLNTLFDKFFGDQILIDRVKSIKNIVIEHNLNLIKIEGTDELKGLTFKNTKTNEIKEFRVSGLFIAIGQIPSNEKFKNLVDLDNGFILTNEKMETKTEGLFSVGDTRKKDVRQVATACSDGSIASFYASRYIDKIKE